MLMASLHHRDVARHTFALAIRAIEAQYAQNLASESKEAASERRRAFGVLDAYAVMIFDAVYRQASTGQQEVYFATLPGFEAASLQALPHQPRGLFGTTYVDDWLRARDLSHIFRSSHRGLVW